MPVVIPPYSQFSKGIYLPLHQIALLPGDSLQHSQAGDKGQPHIRHLASDTFWWPFSISREKPHPPWPGWDLNAEFQAQTEIKSEFPSVTQVGQDMLRGGHSSVLRAINRNSRVIKHKSFCAAGTQSGNSSFNNHQARADRSWNLVPILGMN